MRATARLGERELTLQFADAAPADAVARGGFLRALGLSDPY